MRGVKRHFDRIVEGELNHYVELESGGIRLMLLGEDGSVFLFDEAREVIECVFNRGEMFPPYELLNHNGRADYYHTQRMRETKRHTSRVLSQPFDLQDIPWAEIHRFPPPDLPPPEFPEPTSDLPQVPTSAVKTLPPESPIKSFEIDRKEFGFLNSQPVFRTLRKVNRTYVKSLSRILEENFEDAKFNLNPVFDLYERYKDYGIGSEHLGEILFQCCFWEYRGDYESVLKTIEETGYESRFSRIPWKWRTVFTTRGLKALEKRFVDGVEELKSFSMAQHVFFQKFAALGYEVSFSLKMLMGLRKFYKGGDARLKKVITVFGGVKLGTLRKCIKAIKKKRDQVAVDYGIFLKLEERQPELSRYVATKCHRFFCESSGAAEDSSSEKKRSSSSLDVDELFDIVGGFDKEFKEYLQDQKFVNSYYFARVYREDFEGAIAFYKNLEFLAETMKEEAIRKLTDPYDMLARMPKEKSMAEYRFAGKVKRCVIFLYRACPRCEFMNFRGDIFERAMKRKYGKDVSKVNRACKHTECRWCKRWFCHVCLKPSRYKNGYCHLYKWKCGMPREFCTNERGLMPIQTNENKHEWFIGTVDTKQEGVEE